MNPFNMGARMPMPSGADVPQEDRPVASFRRLTFVSQYSSDERACAFGEEDEAAILKVLVAESGGKCEEKDISSSDFRRYPGADGSPPRVVLILGLAEAAGDLIDMRLFGGCQKLMEGFTTKEGRKITLKEDEAISGLVAARICRVLSRASNDSVRAAFVSRGVPDEAILRVSATTVPGTEVHKLTKVVHLLPGFPLDQIPWKVPLQEPGKCLVPCKVSVQGSHCVVCRSAEHKKNGCSAFKQQLCGRCDLSLAELHSQGRAPANHDCEGGPDGYGAEHLDLYGDKWHRIWVKWRDSLPPCEAPADPLVTARNATLQIAKAAAQKQRAKMAKKKTQRPAPGEYNVEKATPPAKRQQLGGQPPNLDLP
jgi:hypothetical protein